MASGGCRRAFADIGHGQIHYRHAGDLAGPGRPLLMLHGGPGSSQGLVQLMAMLAERGTAIVAPDMMGNGDSDPPPGQPDMPFYVSCLTMLLDALHIDRIDCYGHHFGAQLACELAIHAPQRVGRLVLDGLGLFSAEERALFRDRYAPVLEADADGRHLDWLWAFLSNTTIRFPHYSDRPEDGMPGGAALPPPLLTDIFAGVARNWRTYHFSYRVGFEQDVADRLPQIRHKALILAVAGDPLARYAVLAAALMPNVRVAEIDRAGRADAILSMIDDAP